MRPMWLELDAPELRSIAQEDAGRSLRAGLGSDAAQEAARRAPAACVLYTADPL